MGLGAFSVMLDSLPGAGARIERSGRPFKTEILKGPFSFKSLGKIQKRYAKFMALSTENLLIFSSIILPSSNFRLKGFVLNCRQN